MRDFKLPPNPFVPLCLLLLIAGLSSYHLPKLSPQTKSRSHVPKLFSICGFWPGMTVDQVQRKYNEPIVTQDEKLILQEGHYTVIMGCKDGVVTYVDGGRGTTVELNGKVVFRYATGYHEATEMLKNLRDFKIDHSNGETRVVTSNQVLTVRHRLQTGPLGNKGLIQSIVLEEGLVNPK